MKKYLSLILLCFLSCTESKNDNPTPADTPQCYLTEYTQVEPEFTVLYSYNGNGQPIEANVIYQGRNDGKVKYEYDMQGRLTKAFSYKRDGSLTGYQTYEYNSDGLLIKRIWQVPRDSSFLELSSYTYEYTPTKQLKKYTAHQFGRVDFHHTYEYKGSLMQKEHYFNGQGQHAFTTEFEYDNKKHFTGAAPAIQLIWKPAHPYGHHYPYVRNAVKETKTWVNGYVSQEDSYTTTYTYNSAGYPTKAVRKNLEGKIYTYKFSYSCP